MKPTGHIISTLTISGLLYLFFKSSVAFFASLLAGILIDIDHIFDYYLQQGPTLRVKNIYSWCKELRAEFIFIMFHSIELVFLLWSIVSIFKLGIFWVTFAVGITQHMLLDVFFNQDKVYSYTYCLTYRIIKGFKKKDLFK